MGIVMMFIFVSLYGRQFVEKVGLSFWQGGLETTSCRGALAMLRRNLPAGRRAWCEGNHLALDIPYPGSAQVGEVRLNILCPILYRELANEWKALADSPALLRDILSRVEVVRLRLIHPPREHLFGFVGGLFGSNGRHQQYARLGRTFSDQGQGSGESLYLLLR